MYRDKQMVVYRWISTNVLQVSDDEMIEIANCKKKKKKITRNEKIEERVEK